MFLAWRTRVSEHFEPFVRSFYFFGYFFPIRRSGADQAGSLRNCAGPWCGCICGVGNPLKQPGPGIVGRGTGSQRVLTSEEPITVGLGTLGQGADRVLSLSISKASLMQTLVPLRLARVRGLVRQRPTVPCELNAFKQTIAEDAAQSLKEGIHVHDLLRLAQTRSLKGVRGQVWTGGRLFDQRRHAPMFHCSGICRSVGLAPICPREDRRFRRNFYRWIRS